MTASNAGGGVIRNGPPAIFCAKCGQEIGPNEPVYRDVWVRRKHSWYDAENERQIARCERCRHQEDEEFPHLVPGKYRWVNPEPCDNCGRPVVNPDTYREHVFCSYRCRVHIQANQKKEHRALAREKWCATCGEPFQGSRSDAKYCSSACRQKAYRQRRGP